MIGPIDYSTDVLTPMQSAMQGFQQGANLRAFQQQADAQELALQQQQQAQEAAKLRQQHLYELAQNKSATGADYARVMTMHPELADNLGKAWGAMGQEKQKSELEFRGQVFTALDAGSPETAAALLRERSAAHKNSGMTEEAAKDDVMAKLIELNPDIARVSVGTWLAGVPEGDKVIEAAQKLRLAPVEQRKLEAEAGGAEADAETKRITAKFAEQNAVKDLEKKGWDIKKVVSDIETQREANRIAAMNAATAREGNALKRQELQLKVQEARQALDDKIRAKVADAESSAATMDNFLNTVQRVRNVAVDKDGKPTSTLRAAAGPIDSRMPTMQTDVADLEALVETLGSQAFLSQIPAMRGTGSLTEREGDKLQSSLSNLSLKQSPEQLIENINEAFRLINKARQGLSTRTGVPLPPPDIPAAKPKNGSSEFQAPGGATTTKGGATVSSW